MNEQHSDKNEQREPFDLEQRLRAYYGPQLREQPLAQASWQHVRLQLGSQEGVRQRRRFHWRLPHRKSRAYVPASIQEAFARIIHEARVPFAPAMLRCSLKPRISEPAVRISWLGKRKIHLLLPLHAVTSPGQAELDVLLATGLARSISVRKPNYTLGRLFLVAMLLLACLVLALFWIHHTLLIGVPVAVLLCASVALLFHFQARSLAFYADMLIVLWLGRNRVCSGLHALADRSRTPGRRRWGEPSLEERIERVCGTRVEDIEKLLTLVG